MSEPRLSYYSEQSRNESYVRTLLDEESRNETYVKILDKIYDAYLKGLHGCTLHELSVLLSIETHIVSARVFELREKKFVLTDKNIRRKNQSSGRSNIVWQFNPEKLNAKQYELF